MLSRLRERGDTLIEVLFAVTVFSFVVVGALTIMNQGTAASQRSLEITLVRQNIDAQAESLRFMHAAYVSVYQSNITFNTEDPTTSAAEEWYKLSTQGINSDIDSASAFGGTVTECPTPPSDSFVIDTTNVRFVDGSSTSLVPASTFGQLTYNDEGVFVASEGLWIEGIRAEPPSGENAGFIDFHIRACWEAAGLALPLTTGTIVRLYEPRG